MSRRSNKPVDVFKSIDIPEDGDTKPCWPWLGGSGGKGDDRRGYFAIAGTRQLAYRVVYTLVYGNLGDREVVRHKCDNPICCNPYHLEKGSQSDNENDKYDRDRYGFPLRVLEEIVRLNARKIPQKEIAQMVTDQFGIYITQQRVSDIVTGTRRKRQTDRMK